MTQLCDALLLVLAALAQGTVIIWTIGALSGLRPQRRAANDLTNCLEEMGG